jgi:hypothetical protein
MRPSTRGATSPFAAMYFSSPATISVPGFGRHDDFLSGEHRVAVAALQHEIRNRQRIDLRRIQRLTADANIPNPTPGGSARIDGHCETGNLRKPPVRRRQRRHPVVQRIAHDASGNGDDTGDIAERQHRDQIAPPQRTGGVNAIAADAARVHDRNLGLRIVAQRVGDEIANVGF